MILFFDILYIVLAILGLGFLVFIHELAHYFVARRQKMKVTVFSIGFGKAIYSWKKNGVKWQIGFLPFGGYVKIAGMEGKKKEDLYAIKNGFFSKKPWHRIKVALAGPLANLAFGFVAFALLWTFGGRKQSFSFFTKKIGAVDTSSTLYQKNIRAGDELITYNGRPYNDFKDLLFAAVSKQKKLTLSGNKVDYYHQLKKTPFSLQLDTYSLTVGGERNLSTIGIESPANILLYDSKSAQIKANPSFLNSGLNDQDRILWVNGKIVFSPLQISKLINEPVCFLTVKREGQIFQDRFYKLRIEDLKITSFDADEINDWRYEMGLSEKLQKLYFLNFFFNKKGFVENRISILDEKLARKAYGPDFGTLQPGDRIIAVNGKKVASSYEILEQLQKPSVLMIVQRGFDFSSMTAANCDTYFDHAFLKPDLLKLVQKIGVFKSSENLSSGQLHLLKTIQPITLSTALNQSIHSKKFQKEFLKQKQQILKNPDAEVRKQQLASLEKEKNKLSLGISLKEAKVKYNPNPVSLFIDTFAEMGRTIKALFTGQIHPKWMAGPLGIVQAIQRSWSVSILEVIYWMGFISLNLGLLNLLPLPVLDGGHILFALYEIVTKKKLKSKTMDKLIFPFIILLVLFLIYVIYNDLVRIIKSLF